MRHGNLLVIRGQTGSKGGGGIAMHQHDVGLELAEHAFHTLQDGSSHVSQVLPGLHDVEVKVWLDGKQVQHLVQHLAVLGSNAESGVKTFISGQS
ncbi:MAG: hypothetical protein ACD_23C00945G0003 [uncultured bacterium]|nr:MAG: hypothetical protein ACD_23C00945G0003 [uncultured bacterium]